MMGKGVYGFDTEGVRVFIDYGLWDMGYEL